MYSCTPRHTSLQQYRGSPGGTADNISSLEALEQPLISSSDAEEKRRENKRIKEEGRQEKRIKEEGRENKRKEERRGEKRKQEKRRGGKRREENTRGEKRSENKRGKRGKKRK